MSSSQRSGGDQPTRPDCEQVARLSNGIEICYDTFGSRSDPALLLIMGLSGPMIWWSPEFCQQLADRGFHVIRFDNRDVGRSTTLPGRAVRRRHTVGAYIRGTRGRPPYTLSDMAADAVGLLDHLGISRAHIVGVSMGGMIAQTIVLEHPERVRSLVSMMSSTGRRAVGWQDPRLFPLLLRSRGVDRASYVRQSLAVARMIGSPAYPTAREEAERLAGETFDRGVTRDGVGRQIQAIMAQPDRSRSLRDVTVPTLVIHGLADKMVHVSGGRATAEAIPGAELMLIPGMGHDLPMAVWPAVLDRIESTARRASP
jgi:pimeloyl-ACP methyl ester carboxylesterase